MLYMKINIMLYTSYTSNFKKEHSVGYIVEGLLEMDTSYRILQLVGTEKEVAFFEPGDSGMQSESESESCSVVFNSL